MKWKIVGWTEYDDFDVECAEENSYAATNAIIDEIKKKGYCFSGWAHQELFNGAPVLNDGKKRLYSQRIFGGLMANAHGYHGPMDYSLFAFQMRKEETPPITESFCADEFTAETDLNEEFSVEVSEEVFAKAVETKEFKDAEREDLRYIDAGDTLNLKCGEKTYSGKVVNVWSEKDITEDDRMALYMHEEGAEEKWRNARKLLIVQLEGYKPPVLDSSEFDFLFKKK